MKWVIIKGVRYPISVVSAFAAYYGDNPFLKIRIRNKYHIIYFDNMDGNYIPVYTSLSIIITNSHKLIGIEFVRNKERR